ncbi:RidA family protein [Leptospira sp. GIMC2001]|uniref:RidA family protein n=1 Tax=Leptospira sp. GIMC2001 TaxID=1513297 RepID=UPI00234AB2A0|nr:RidA family protein [Leptospira sp. GIMC2001]WCL50962.1 RidA family protein [Leptospira sp. GIMC2001]
MSFETQLESLGYKLPPSPKALASYIPAIRSGNFIWTSGQLPMIDGNLGLTGKLGYEVSIEEGMKQAKTALLNALACIKAEIGDLDQIQRVLKLGVYVASIPDFTEHHLVANGASDALQAIFGDKGRHVRFAIGVASLPLDACVELELMVELK